MGVPGWILLGTPIPEPWKKITAMYIIRFFYRDDFVKQCLRVSMLVVLRYIVQ